ncbi:hypothetical protein EHS25_001768 [Saitozyma podzolica]|uniref:Uncharacterized protein n=1 Tax=Saitozyma podzolica TaxID=1890683 RepID=A0A427YFA2_9TREE|nr:hypothetical protein EHS25_001768 [Saitozyma podzolica]
MLFSTPSSLSDPSLNTDEAHLSAMLRKDMSDLIPLTEETYPREIETKTPDQGYYIALGAILLVWMITPLSCAYLVWYTVSGRGMSGQGGLTPIASHAAA